MRLVHLTDPHLSRPGERRFGLDPWARLDAALDHVRRHEAAADVLLLSGDLANDGEPEAYTALAERLVSLPQRVVLLLGNHDDRKAFKAEFPEAAVDDAGFVQAAVDGADGVSLLGLDTLVAGAAHGALDEGRLEWLERRLAERRDRAVFLAMHHPPVACGIPGMDAIGLTGAEDFWRVVEAAPQVRHVFAGHIHRPFFARRGHVGVSTLPGPAHQLHLQFEAEGAVIGSHEPGAYGIARLAPDTFDLHVRAFTDTSPRFLFDEASERAATPETLPPVPPRYRHLL